MKNERRARGGWLGVTFAAIGFTVLATVAFANGGGQHPAPLPVITMRPLTASPAALPGASAKPVGRTACQGINLKSVAVGTKVPLACLPRLPQKTSRNTATPSLTAASTHGRLHPMAATGATIDLTSGAACGTSGALYAVGCSLTWEATNNADWSATDTFQDYYVPPNATTATAVGATYTTTPVPHVTVLSLQGTYAFFVYDTTQQIIVSIVYANAGQSFQIGVYADPYHTDPSYQFNVNTDTAAYIYLPNVSTSDVYVAYVLSTSVNTYCVFITPAATPQPGTPIPMPTGPANSLLCNPATSVGEAAPGGTLSLTWPLNNAYPAGTYSVVVFDKTANQAVGQVQVSLTGFTNYGFLLHPTPAAAPTPAVFSTPQSTVFAWDSINDQSTGGIVASVPNQVGTAPTNGIYRLTASDPDGQVVEIPATNVVPNTCTTVSNSAAACTVIGTFVFQNASPALNAPGNYPNNTWTMQLYAPGDQTVSASQAFTLVGYSMQTEFKIGGVLGTTLTFGCCTNGATYNQAASLIFTNDGNINYPNAADPLRGIEYGTGPASVLGGAFTPPSGATGYGVTFALAGCAGAYNTVGCSATVVDSSGNNWTVTDYCSTATPATPGLTNQCVIAMFPTTANRNLVAGASLTISGTFYAQGGTPAWSCYNIPCLTTTSIWPQDGISWSSTNTNSPAWTPIYYGSSGTSIAGTTSAHFIGTCQISNCATTSRYAVAVATSPPTLPWTNTHFYQSQFAQADYQISTPFAAANGQEDILVLNVSDCNAAGAPAPSCAGASAEQLGEVQVSFPSGILVSGITIDPLEPKNPNGTYYVLATNGANGCNNAVGTSAICINPGGTSYNTGGNKASLGIPIGGQGQIWLDVPASQAAYLSQELQVQAWSTTELTYTTLTADGHTETPVAGGAVAGTPVDSLSLQGLSLNSNLMASSFNPTTVSPGAATTTYGINFTNTSFAADPNPDPVDAIVLEQVTSKTWNLTAPSFTGTGSAGWANLSGVGYNPAGNDLIYWFGVCAAQYNVAAIPPQVPPSPVNPTTQQPAVGACTAAQEQDAVAPGGLLNINFTLANTTTGTQTFYLYAHGANGGGWSSPKTLTVTSTAETGSAKFFSVNQGATDASCKTTSNVPINTVATVAKSPNCFIYEVTNTSSAAQKIGTVDIALPAYDVNGLATSNGPPIDWSLVGSPITQYLVLGTISAGTFTVAGVPAGCAINAAQTFNPVPGSTPGNIEVNGCTGFNPGTNIAVEFVANTPQTESNSYLLPAKIDGAVSGLAWQGSDQINIAFSLGLSVTVDPANPGPGGSHPSVVCNPAQCTFSGETLDMGAIPAFGTVTGTDVVRATVVYEGATLAGACPANAGVAANTWQLQVSLSQANPNNELFTSVDNANSTTGLSYNVAGGVLSFFNPTTVVTTLACGQETANTDYDVLQNFQTQPGADTAGHSVTVIYTLISN